MKKIVIGINIFYILLWWCHFQVYNWYMHTRRSASHRTENQKKPYKVALSHRQYCNYAIWGDSAHLLIILKKSNKEIAYFMFNWALLRSACFVYRQQHVHVPSACSTDSRFHMFWYIKSLHNPTNLFPEYNSSQNLNKDWWWLHMNLMIRRHQLRILRIVHTAVHKAISLRPIIPLDLLLYMSNLDIILHNN